MMKAMQAEGVEWAEAYRGGARQAGFMHENPNRGLATPSP